MRLLLFYWIILIGLFFYFLASFITFCTNYRLTFDPFKLKPPQVDEANLANQRRLLGLRVRDQESLMPGWRCPISEGHRYVDACELMAIGSHIIEVVARRQLLQSYPLFIINRSQFCRLALTHNVRVSQLLVWHYRPIPKDYTMYHFLNQTYLRKQLGNLLWCMAIGFLVLDNA